MYLSRPFISPAKDISQGEEITVKRILVSLTIVCILFCVSGGSAAERGKLGASLRLLKDLRGDPGLERGMLGAAAGALQAETIILTVKFEHVLSPAEIAGYESRGASFFYLDGEVARTRSIYPVRVPWSMVDEMAGRRDVLRLEGSWRPAVYPLLDVSNPEVEADSAWHHADPLGNPLTGTGLRIADFDTGIDVFHPSFFRADGDTFDWVDFDGLGLFDPHWDGIDLNRNGQFDTGENLDYFDGWIYDPAHVWGYGNPNNADNGLQTYWDWLYNDANANRVREYGTADGYTESDPTFGERLFVHLDDNGNGYIEQGEKLVALGTSKIAATMNSDETERVRGVDLILSDEDTNGHGTAVSGILAGGTAGHHIFTGLAPGAEVLAGNFFADNPISLLIPWARGRGADVMLYEFGGFVFDYLDGSSLEEELISIENETIIQITPSGNLGRGDKHAIATSPAADSVVLYFNVPWSDINYLYHTTLWTTAEGDLTFRLTSPYNDQVTLEGSVSDLSGYYIWFEKSTSPRGTCALDLYVYSNLRPSCVGDWELTIVNNTGGDIETINNIADEVSSWADGVEWQNFATDQRNVTWPATSDSAFCNGSYSTRGFEGYEGVGGGTVPTGEISVFSGRGERIDGKHLLDICSPGNYDVYSTRSHQDSGGYPLGCYRQFSGTSAAGPHVAAAAALVQQAFPSATMDEVAYLLASHAAADSYTGDVYNDTWGYGKLRILGAVGVATAVEDMAMGMTPPDLLLDRNYPNPFNPTTWIPFYLPSDGVARITIYDVRGAVVKVLRDRWMPEGAHSIRWNGDGAGGRAVASGIYFCVLEHAGEVQSRKLVLLR